MQMICETNRLMLKVLSDVFASDVLAFYWCNKDFFEPWEPERVDNFYTLHYHKASLSYEYNQIVNSKALRYWVFKKEDPELLIGSVSCSNILKGPFSCGQIGYKFDQNHCGNGFAKESLEKFIEILFNDLKLHRIEASIMPNNMTSIHLIEQLGFQYEGISIDSIQINGKWESHMRYALINPLL